MLFPTYYSGEGFAGTLIDAFSAGVPVIASDWKYNAEIVNEDVGCLFAAGKTNELKKILLDIANDPNQILIKKKLCLKEAQKFCPDRAAIVLIGQL